MQKLNYTELSILTSTKTLVIPENTLDMNSPIEYKELPFEKKITTNEKIEKIEVIRTHRDWNLIQHLLINTLGK